MPGGAGGGLGGGLGDLMKGGLGGLLAGGAAGSILSGGLGDLLKQFQDNGHGETANSWVGPGPNKAIDPGDLANALGADQINAAMSQSGLSREELLQGLEQVPAGCGQSHDPGRTAADRARGFKFALRNAARIVGARTKARADDGSPVFSSTERIATMGGFLWIVIVGFVAGIIARLLSPGPNNPSGFILTTVIGIVGAFLATFIGQAIGHYGPNQGAGFITATIGALVVLFILEPAGGTRHHSRSRRLIRRPPKTRGPIPIEIGTGSPVLFSLRDAGPRPSGRVHRSYGRTAVRPRN